MIRRTVAGTLPEEKKSAPSDMRDSIFSPESGADTLPMGGMLRNGKPLQSPGKRGRPKSGKGSDKKGKR